MPNYYTAPIYDNKPFTLKDFLLRVGSPTTDPTELQKRLDEATTLETLAQNELNAFQKLDQTQLKALHHLDYQNRLERYNQAIQEQDSLKQRYESLIQQLKSWSPPKSLSWLKDNALAFLRDSLEHDCHYHIHKPRQTTLHTFIQEHTSSLQSNINHHTQQKQYYAQLLQEYHQLHNTLNQDFPT